MLNLTRDWAEDRCSGLYVPYKIARRRRRPTCIDLFCGCGGFSLGMMEGGFEVLAGLDWEPYAMITYMHNLGSYPAQIHYIEPSDKERAEKTLLKMVKKEKDGTVLSMPLSGQGMMSNTNGRPPLPPVKHFFFGDVRKITGKDILEPLGLEPGEVDCVCGGPPCQGFSMAGRRNVVDPRNSLVFEFARLVGEIQPKTFMMENVPGMLSMVTPEGIPVIDALALTLEQDGFATAEAIKQILLSTSGVGMAKRGAKSAREARQVSPPKIKEPHQASLFGGDGRV